MKANENNLEIREAITKKRLRYYEVAEQLGVSIYTLSHWLQKELTGERREKVLKAINDIVI